MNDILWKATAWTLVHSVWQGFLAALLAGMIVLLTRKATAALRYRLLAVLFFGFLLAAGGTFLYEFGNGENGAVTNLNLPLVQGQPGQSLLQIDTIATFDLINQFLNVHATTIVIIWFLFFSLKFFGIFNGFVQIYRIRNYRNFPVSDYWKRRVSELASAINLNKAIVLLESTIVKVPSVTGFFKPIILVPMGLLAHLPHDQAEAILLHELAHIKRKDYLIHLLQQLAEMLFFFNPGLLWLSLLLREERENCCDDIAVAVIENKAQLVRALVSFEEYRFENATLSLAFGQKKQHLLGRAKRILQDSNHSLGRFEKTFLSLGFVAIAIGFLACSSRNPTEAEIADLDRQRADAIAEQAELRMKNDNQAYLQHLEELDSLAKDTETQARDTETQARDTETAAAENDAHAREEVERMSAEDKTRQIQVKPPVNQAAYIYPYVPTENCAPVNKTTRTVTTKTESAQTYEREEAVYDSQRKEYDKKVSYKSGVSGQKLPDNLNVDRLTGDIISDLIAERVVSSTKNLSFKLSHMNLVVNGVEQPASVHQRLSAKYVEPRYTAICYNFAFPTEN